MTPVRGSYGLVMPAPITGAPPAINEGCEGRIDVVFWSSVVRQHEIEIQNAAHAAVQYRNEES
jgi:hypothetical protein